MTIIVPYMVLFAACTPGGQGDDNGVTITEEQFEAFGITGGFTPVLEGTHHLSSYAGGSNGIWIYWKNATAEDLILIIEWLESHDYNATYYDPFLSWGTQYNATKEVNGVLKGTEIKYFTVDADEFHTIGTLILSLQSA